MLQPNAALRQSRAYDSKGRVLSVSEDIGSIMFLQRVLAWYDTFGVIDCSFAFWCFQLLKARKRIIFEPFVRRQKRLKRVQAFATDSEPFKG